MSSKILGAALVAALTVGVTISTPVASASDDSAERAASAPIGCALDEPHPFANTTPVTIEASTVGTYTSTVSVSGLDRHIWDVDVRTAVTHSFSTDIDMTVTSPAGTIVTLTTDNGSDKDNVFNGTLWDDSADPGGPAPYTTQDRIVTDRSYTNLLTAATVTPEEPLGAFRGEDPNGVWTLTVVDDASGDGGSLNSWGLLITTMPASPTTLVTGTASVGISSSPGQTLTDNATTVASQSIGDVDGRIVDVDVQTTISHTFPGDLDITLTSPWGTSVTLTTDNGSTNDNVFNGTRWNDDNDPAGVVPSVGNSSLVTDHTYSIGVPVPELVPEEPLSAFNGEDPNGTWILTISDDQLSDTGLLVGWEIDFTVGHCVEVPAAPTHVTGKERNRSLVVSWDPPTDDGGALIERYRVVTVPGGKSCSSLATTCTVKNLRNGVAYGVVVTAKNLAGRGPGSSSVAPMVPRTKPTVPRRVTAEARTKAAEVSWLAPASNGGARISGYVVISKPGKKRCTTKGALSCTVTKLRSGTTYTFTVKARNEAGASAASSRSNSVQVL